MKKQPGPDELAAYLANLDQRARQNEQVSPVLWDNLRWGTKGAGFSGGLGILTWDVPYPNGCFGVVCYAQRVTGFNWSISQNAPPNEIGVSLAAWQYDPANANGYYTGVINISFIALGF